MFVSKIESTRLPPTQASWAVRLLRQLNPMALSRIRYRLNIPLYWEETDRNIVVPDGFVTDFMTIPRIFWWYFRRDKRYIRPSVLHDYLYASGRATKSESDQLFYLAMRSEGISRSMCCLIFLSVTMFGMIPWTKWDDMRIYDPNSWEMKTGLKRTNRWQ